MENKKSHKVLKIILFILLALIIIFAIHSVRNYIIIDEIAKKQSALNEKTNYSFTSKQYDYSDENAKAVLEHFTKDNNSKILRKDNGKSFVMWGGKEEEETLIIDETNLKAAVCKTSTPLKSYIPILININSTTEKILFAMFSFITTDKIEERDCYEIKIPELEAYIDKENGTVLKTTAGTVEKEGKEYKCMIEYSNYKFDELTDEDVARPDLTGYEVTYNEEN